MDFNKFFLLRLVIGLFGIFLIIVGIWQAISLFLKDFIYLLTFHLTLQFILIVIGFSFFFTGLDWNKIFKRVAKVCFLFSFSFLSISILAFLINSNSETILSEVQPSLDQIILISMGDDFNEFYNDSLGKKVKLKFSKSSNLKRIYIQNATLDDMMIFSNAINFTNFTFEDKFLYTKYIIKTTYERFNENNQSNMPILMSDLISQFSNTEKSKFLALNKDSLKTLFEKKEIKNLYLDIIFEEGTYLEEFEIGRLSQKEVDEIFLALGIPREVVKTENLFSNILLTTVYKTNQNGVSINYLKYYLVPQINPVIKYDFITENLRIKQNALNSLVVDCNNKNLTIISTFCEIPEKLNYENVFKNILNESKKNKNISSENLIFLNKFSTLPKLKTYLEKMTSNWFFIFWIFIILITIGVFFYYLDLKLNYQYDYYGLKVPVFMFKTSFWSFLQTTIIISVLYYILLKGSLFELVLSPVTQSELLLVQILNNTPIYLLSINIFHQFMVIQFWILLILLFLYISFTLFRRKVEN